MRKALLVAGLFLFAGEAARLDAQTTSARPESAGAMIMRAYACGSANMDSATNLLVGSRGAIALQLVSEGLLRDYQVLHRSWGDEWDVIEIITADDEEAFQFASEELELRMFVSDQAPARARTFDTLCPRRKHSLYKIISTP